MKRLLLTICTLLALAPAVRGRAQDEAPSVPADAPRVAVIPLGNKDGTDGAHEKTASALRTLIEKRGYRVLEGDSVRKAYKDAVGETPGAKEKLLTIRDKDVLKVGRKLDVRYVLAANLRWHTKTIYVFPSLRTKADCTVDALVVDVDKSEVILDKHDIERDRENKNAAAGVAAVLVGLGYGVLSGGPKTPPQTRAGVIALYAALDDFIGVRSGPRKIDEDKTEKSKGSNRKN